MEVIVFYLNQNSFYFTVTSIDNSALTLGKVCDVILGSQNCIHTDVVAISFGTFMNVMVSWQME